MVAESFLELLLDGPHWGVEVVSEVTFFVIELLILDKLLHLHGKHGRKHG